MAEWPLDLSGVTETVVATQGPEANWNFAALGVHAPEDGSQQARARTWGETRTYRNFQRRGAGVVQFTRDSLLFVRAALDVLEGDQPVQEGRVDAWVRADVEQIANGREGNTEWADWRLTPVESVVISETVGRFERGPAAVVEASVAASRLAVPAYDTETLRERIAYCGGVVERCGDDRSKEAFDVLCELAEIDHD